MDESDPKPPVINDCPDCSQAIDVSGLGPFAQINCPHCKASVRVRRTMGQYHITGLLGEGGMSQVFKAVDVHLQREVALKILHQNLSLDSSLTSMFEREAKLTASILHPNVVKVYTVGRDQGYFFIAMEIIDAESLEQRIADKGCLAEREVLHIAHDVTSGLKAAYEEGLIHRDIKPGNMLVMKDGTAKLVDFGLAVHQDGEDESEELWATPYYVPPEKLDGASDTHLGDIYSLGATLFHAVAGKPPFEANTSSMEELKEIKKQTLNLRGEAPSLSKPTLKLIEKMMAYRPEDRIESYDAILEKIGEIEGKQFGAAPRERVKKQNPVRRKRLAGAAVLLGVVILVLVSLVSNREEEAEEPLGISAEERVISAGDNSNTEKFLQGRDLLVSGNFRKAESIFDELTGETGMASATRMWSHYFLGLSRLFLGQEVKARESFAYIEAVPDATGAEMDQIRRFMLTSSKVFSSPLPIVDGTEPFAGSALEGLGLLTAAVKNWQHGQFESAIRLFDAFAEQTPPADFDWIGGLSDEVEAFRSDWEVLAALPNPTRREVAALAAQRDALTAASGKLGTRGAAEQLVKRRLSRIDAIREVVAAERAAKAAEMAATQPEPEAGSPPAGTPAMAEPGGEAPLTAVEESDRARLLEGIAGAAGQQTGMRFGEIALLLAELEMASVRGAAWQRELVSGYGKADEFVGLLAAELAAQGFAGEIRRREGVPLDAEITAANSSFFVVDLGFGPNEVSVDQFAPEWMLETAETLLGSPTSLRRADWERVIYFSLATEEAGTADRLADALAEEDAEFRSRWELLERFRSG